MNIHHGPKPIAIAMFISIFALILSAQSAPVGAVTDFETTNYWSPSSGSATLSTNATQGVHSLSVNPSNYTSYTSSHISLTGPVERVSFDLWIPNYPIFTWWKGDAQMFIDCPSQGVHNQYMGYIGLTSLNSREWHTLHFYPPAEVIAALEGKTVHDLTFQFVLNVPASIFGPHLVDNMKINGPVLDVRVMAVVVGSDGSSGHTTDLYNTTSFNRDSVITTMQYLKESWSQAGINFLFNPKSDILEAKSSLLNEEFPISGGNLVLPLPSGGVGDFINNPNVVAQRQFADELGDVAVVYFRDANWSWYEYIDTNGDTVNALPAAAWSGLNHKYVRFPKSLTLRGRLATWPHLLIHEMGHYFSLAHTHAWMFSSAAAIADSIKAKVDRGEYTQTTIWEGFDGDRGTTVGDTPYDPGENAMAHANGGDKCGPTGTLNIPVTFSDGSSQTYNFAPLRDNLISYYVGCNEVEDLRMTPDQVNQVRNTAIWSVERKNLTEASGVRVTAVFEPYSGEEQQSFLWEYGPHRKNYDYIWGEDWRLAQLRTFTRHGTMHYSATWRPSSSGEFQIYNATYDEYRYFYDEKWGLGFRLQNLSISEIAGVPRYTAVFRPSTSSEFQIYNATYAEYRAWYDQKWTEGYRLVILEPYLIGNQLLYTAVVRPSTSAEFQLYNATYSEFRPWYDQKWSEGYRLHSLKVLRVPGQEARYYAVVKPSTSAEYQVYNWTYEEFRKEYDKLSTTGWALKSVSFYE